MESLFIYIFKASIGILLFYLLYVLLFGKETFFKANRYYLIAGLVLSLLLPVFTYSYIIDVPLNIQPTTGEVFDPATGNMLIPKGNAWIWTVPFILYLTGAGLLALRLFRETIQVIRLIRSGERNEFNGVTVINSEKAKTPFSFFNYVIIDTEKYSEEEFRNIISHEKVHIRERHWIDLLIIELLTVVFWINPLIWLYEKTIKQNHEYLADQGVIRQGYHPGQYQAFLINQLLGINVIGFTNNLNFSLNKNRMKMMKKEKTPTIRRLKLLLVLPVISVLIFAFATPEYRMNALSDTASSDKVVVEGKLFNEIDKTPIGGANIIVQGKTTGTISDGNGNFKIEVDSEDVLVISYVGYETVRINVDEHTSIKAMIAMKPKVYDITPTEVVAPPPPPPPSVSDAPPPPPVEDSPEEVFIIVEEMPEYTDGGTKGFIQDVEAHAAEFIAKTGFKGKIFMQFTVDTDGSVKEIGVARSTSTNDSNATGEELSKALSSIVSGLDPWNTGKQRGRSVKVRMVLPINFK